MSEPGPFAAVTPPPASGTPDPKRVARDRCAADVYAVASPFHGVAELASDSIFVLDPDDPDVPLRILYVNPAGAEAHGYAPCELTGTSLLGLIEDPDRVIGRDYVARILAGDVVTFEESHRHRSGRTFPVEVRARRIDWEGRRAILGLDRDLTERKRIETELAGSEERLRLALVSGRLGAFDWDLATDRIVWSDTHYELFGYVPGDPAVVTYRHFADRVVPEDIPPLETNIERARQNRGEHRAEFRIRLPDGSIRWVLGVGRFYYDNHGTAVRMLGYAQDITDRKENELDLRTVNDRYGLLAGSMQDIIYLMGRDGTGSYVSPSCERLLGYKPEDVIGQSPTAFVHPDEREAFARSKDRNFAGQPTHEEWRYRHKDGRWVWMESLSNPVFDESGAVTGIVCCVRDITRRKAAEDRSRQTQKLEAIGQLAGGIAHDFNNLLTVVNGCAELLLGALPSDDPGRRIVEDIARAGERGAALTRQLLTFSRQHSVRAGPLDVNDLLSGTSRLLARLLGADVSLRTHLDPAVSAVRMDAGQFEQVVVNLAVNARDAMPNGGRITITTAEEDVSGRDDLPPDVRPGRYVCMAVADGGVGMTPEVQKHLFEPFFTTKPVGRGTGLGLATVHGIVRQAGGFVTVESSVGMGTTVRVHVPAVPRNESRSAPDLAPRDFDGGTETVLVVEDDDAVRTVTCTILERKGYGVIPAASAAEALGVCDTRTGLPRLVVTDLIMPGMTGRELADELVRRDPAVKVIYLSGYSSDTLAFRGLVEGRVAFLQKPFAADSLTRLVRRMLDSPA